MSQSEASYPDQARRSTVTASKMNITPKPTVPRAKSTRQRSKSSSPDKYRKAQKTPRTYACFDIKTPCASSNAQVPRTRYHSNTTSSSAPPDNHPISYQGRPYPHPPLHPINRHQRFTQPPWLSFNRLSTPRDKDPLSYRQTFEFHPRIPYPDSAFDSPIPRPTSYRHAVLIKEALTQFHLAVYLADEDAGGDQGRRGVLLDRICEARMPGLRRLGVKKHQIVFFYHGRGEKWMGNEVWEAMERWQMREIEKVQSDGVWRDMGWHEERVDVQADGSASVEREAQPQRLEQKKQSRQVQEGLAQESPKGRKSFAQELEAGASIQSRKAWSDFARHNGTIGRVRKDVGIIGTKTGPVLDEVQWPKITATK